MATVRFSVNPQDAAYQVVQAVGAATATKSIELTFDVGAMASAGLSANQIRLQVILALEKIQTFIEANAAASGKFSLAG